MIARVISSRALRLRRAPPASSKEKPAGGEWSVARRRGVRPGVPPSPEAHTVLDAPRHLGRTA